MTLPNKPMTDSDILRTANEQARLLSIAHDTTIYVAIVPRALGRPKEVARRMHTGIREEG